MKRNCEVKNKGIIKTIVALSFACIVVLTMGVLSVKAAETNSYYPEFRLDDAKNASNEVEVTPNANLSYEGISEETISNGGTSVYAANNPPVAGLAYAILNPESMNNGQITTDTQIAWLWSYNGVNYTYDPDGDSISDMKIGGISNDDIIGMMQGNIGFATQFTVAGQYQLTFQVQDSQGAWSDIVKYVVNVEPANGNTRPVCNLVYTPQYLIPQQMMMISWAQSTDADASDYIVGAGGMVVKDGVTTSLSDYLVQLNETDCALSFSETGSYEIWIRVSDNRNAWSNWSIFTVQVEAAKLSNININGYESVPTEDAWWVDNDYAKAITKNVSADWAGASYLYETCGSNNFPGSLPLKMVSDNDFIVSGTISTASGRPVANTNVSIKMPMTLGAGINASVLTDASGNFVYSLSSSEFWVQSGYYENAEGIDWITVGDVLNNETTYIRSSSTGTNYVYETKVTVACGAAEYSEDVTAMVGYYKLQSVGDLLYKNGSWYYF